MFKKTTTKLFLGFAPIIFFEAAVLGYAFSRLAVRETETYLLDSLSRRSQIAAVSITSELERGKPLQHILDKRSISLLDEKGNFAAGEKPPIHFQNLSGLLPPSGSVVTPCLNEKSESYYCAFTYLPALKNWVFEWTPHSSVWTIASRFLKEIFALMAALMLAALGAAYVLSNVLLKPLRRFARAASQVAEGNYKDIELPLDRADEIGNFAHAFQRMMLDLQEREKNIAVSGMRLAHAARLASIGQMGAGIAHEIKNPLTSMMGYAKILMQKSNDPTSKEAAEVILKEAERCNLILQQMLRFARNDPEEKKPYSMKEVLESSALLLKAEARNKNLTLKLETSGDDIVVGSAQQMQQVILNLCLNAFHASSPGGQVILRTKEENGGVTVEIQDFGAGIPTALQAKIFDPFFTTKSKKEGTGLGLSLAHEIIAGQGGTLSFESTEGAGTVFSVQLPSPKALRRS